MNKIIPINAPPEPPTPVRIVFTPDGNYWRGMALYAASLFDTFTEMAEVKTKQSDIVAALNSCLATFEQEKQEKISLALIATDDEGDWIITDLTMESLVNIWQTIHDASLDKKTREIVKDSPFYQLEMDLDLYSDWEENLYWAIDDTLEMHADNGINIPLETMNLYNDKARDEMSAPLLTRFKEFILNWESTKTDTVPFMFGDLNIDPHNYSYRQALRNKADGEDIDISEDRLILQGEVIHPIPARPTLRVLRP